MQKGDKYYCDKCGKGVLMSWTCPTCQKLLCDICSGMSDPKAAAPKNMGGFTVQSLGGREAHCPYCEKPRKQWWQFWK